MDYRKMDYFIKVVDFKSFTKAAQSLYISQSTLSEQIMKLEEELNCKLLIRKYKTIALTREGELFYAFAKDSLTNYNNLLDDLHKISNTINVGLFFHFNINQWIDKINTFNCEHTQSIHYSLYYMDEMKKKLINNELDIGLCFKNEELSKKMNYHFITHTYIGLYSYKNALPDIIYSLDSHISLIDHKYIDSVLKNIPSNHIVYKQSLEEIMFELNTSNSAALLVDSLLENYSLIEISNHPIPLEIGWYYNKDSETIEWIIDHLN